MAGKKTFCLIPGLGKLILDPAGRLHGMNFGATEIGPFGSV
jgi:hypothetical protein